MVTAKVTGDLPEIAKYRFDYKLSTDTSWKTSSTRVSNYRTYGYTYQLGEEATGKEYNLRVTAIDVEGEPYTSEIVTAKAEYKGYYFAMYSSTNDFVGKTVDYMPEITTSTISTSLTGYSSTQKYTTKEVGWFIWRYDSRNIYLCADMQLNEYVQTGSKTSTGCDPIYNAVLILNRISQQCYSNSKYLGQLARHLNIGDIKQICILDYESPRTDSYDGADYSSLPDWLGGGSRIII